MAEDTDDIGVPVFSSGEYGASVKSGIIRTLEDPNASEANKAFSRKYAKAIMRDVKKASETPTPPGERAVMVDQRGKVIK